MKKKRRKKMESCNNVGMLSCCYCHYSSSSICIFLLAYSPSHLIVMHCINCALSNEKFCSSAFTQRHRQRALGCWYVVENLVNYCFSQYCCKVKKGNMGVGTERWTSQIFPSLGFFIQICIKWKA